MKYLILPVIALFLFSCEKEKILQLPEIDRSEIGEIQDVSAAYLFYDETQADSVELNRKNLISTTNWLVNVDKRLTLKQAIPHIKFLQEKKANSGHKNENAKNYFTCHDLSRNNLGFLEFTDIVYPNRRVFADFNKNPNLKGIKNQITINFDSHKVFRLINPKTGEFSVEINAAEMQKKLKEIDSDENIIYFDFSAGLLFKDYIKFKSEILNADLKRAKVSKEELVYKPEFD